MERVEHRGPGLWSDTTPAPVRKAGLGYWISELEMSSQEIARLSTIIGHHPEVKAPYDRASKRRDTARRMIRELSVCHRCEDKGGA